MERTHRILAVLNAACRGVLLAFRRTFRSGYDVVRFASALLLLVAAGLKGYQLATEPVLGAGVFESRWFLIGVVEFELFFGLWLLSGLLPSPFGRGTGGEGLTWLATLACFSVFTCVSLYKAMSGHATCGCFGKIEVNPWWTGMLDILLVISLLCCRPKSLEAPIPIDLKHLCIRLTGVLAAWLVFGGSAAYAMGNYANTTLSAIGDVMGNGKIVVLEPEKWIGKRFPLLDYIDIGDKLEEGEWLVLLYHHDCPKCQETIRNLKHIVCQTTVQQVALIEMPPHGETIEPLYGSGIGVIHGQLSDGREWFAQTPLVLTLDHGRTITVRPADDRMKRSRIASVKSETDVVTWGAIALESRMAQRNGMVGRNGPLILEPERGIGSSFPLQKYPNVGDKLYVVLVH